MPIISQNFTRDYFMEWNLYEFVLVRGRSLHNVEGRLTAATVNNNRW
jgi:hypothetical protein